MCTKSRVIFELSNFAKTLPKNFLSTKTMQASTDYFISVVECNRILYDKSSSDFKNAVKKEEAWKRIGRVTNMTAEAAKKRYTSLRQKYCREKQKEELNRRYKRKGGAPWVYSKRLKFLDDFIKARTTYTNDANFEDVRDDNSDADFEHTDEMALNGPDDNDLPPDDLNEEAGNNNSDIALQSDIQMQTISYHPEDVQRNVSIELIDDPETASAFISMYSGELTVFEPTLERDKNVREPVNESSETCDSSNTSEVPSNQEPFFEIGKQSVEPDVSSHTMNSSSQREPLLGNVNQSTEAGGNSRASEPPFQQVLLLGSDSRKRKLTTQQHQTTFGPTFVQPSIQSLGATTSSAGDTSSMNVALTDARQVPRKTFTQPSNQPTRPALTVSTASLSSAASSSAQDKTMDNIRHKMDSCLTAIATKVAEKPQRSPYAPFLAYLGTKLPNVPKEKMADLEKEILNIVDNFCQ